MALENKNQSLIESNGTVSGFKVQLPKSAREVLNILRTNGALKPGEIRNHTSLSNRTIRYALKILVDDAIISRVPDLNDLRTHYYKIA